MAVHDVDRTGPDRGNPNPNTHDLNFVSSGGPIINTPRPAHGTNSVNYITDATSADGGPSILAGNLRLVQSQTVAVTSDGVHNTNTTTVPHNLGYKPFLTWSMNNLSTSTLTGVNLIAPQAQIFTLGASSITFQIMTWLAVDATNVYIQLFDTTGLSHNYDITYYLYQQESGV